MRLRRPRGTRVFVVRTAIGAVAVDSDDLDAADVLVSAAQLVDIADPVSSLEFQFVGNFDPPCRDALDFDDNGFIDVSDPIANLTHQFLGGPPPAPPGKDACGIDPTEDHLNCESYQACG